MAENQRRAMLASINERRPREEDTTPAVTMPEKYGTKRYWDARYEGEDEYDWLCSWSSIRDAVEVPPSRILHVGCGTSTMGVAMTEDGFDVVNCDYSEPAIEKMRRWYPDHDWIVADALALPFPANSFAAVVEKGTLDALACGDKTSGRRFVRECLRVAPTLISISFGQPQTRTHYFDHVNVRKVSFDPVVPGQKKPSPVYVYTSRKIAGSSRWRRWVFGVVGALVASTTSALVHHQRRKKLQSSSSSVFPPPGTARCNYELLRDFTTIASGLRWTLGAGTLLGAMRSEPPGLLPWEHDVDVYVLAPDAFGLLDRLRTTTGVLRFRGHVDRHGGPCCGFGFKLFHAGSSRCELDVLVLAETTYAPWAHGKHRLWPPWGPALAALNDVVRRDPTTTKRNKFLVIPEDVDQKMLCADSSRWTEDNASWAGGPNLAYFHNEYFSSSEFLPIHQRSMYDLAVNIPNDPWASLRRTYGPDCAHTARIDDLGISVDLRDPSYGHLRRPVDILDVL